MADRSKQSYRENNPRLDRLEALIQADPEAARRLLEKAVSKVLRPHSEGQREVLTSDERFLVLCAGRRWGKEAWVEERLLTPDGWKRYGDVQVGDYVTGSDGKPTRVVGVYPQGTKRGYRVTFSDGTSVVAGMEHLWQVSSRRGDEVLSTRELLRDYKIERPDGKLENRYSIPNVAPVEYSPSGQKMPLSPWLLGALLGDGALSCSGFSTADPEMVSRVACELPEGASIVPRSNYDYGLRGLLQHLRQLGLEGKRSWEKSIPWFYMTATPEQRLELLRGLLDTDGNVDRGRAEFCSTSRRLAEQVVDLVRGLGGIATLRVKTTTHRDAYVVRIRMQQCPFWLARKARAWRPGRTTKKIVSIAPTAYVEMLCIEVDAPDGLYVLTDYTVTHNTKVGAARALREARKDSRTVWWVAPTYKIVKRGYGEVLRQLPEGVLSKPAPPETAFDAGRSIILNFKNGSRMEFYSAERPEGMLGGASDFVIVDEAATMPEATWTQFIRATLADRQGGALFISTPRSKNWFYRMWVKGQDEHQPDYRSWKFPSFTNPTIPAEEWEEMRETLPAAVYEQEVLAEFVSPAASVFRIPDSGVVPLQRPQGHVVFGIDLAKLRDFTVILGVREGDRKPCHHERFNAVSWPEQRRRIHDAVQSVIDAGATGVTVMLDSTGLGDVVYDDLSFEGLDVVPIKFSPQWKQQAVMLLAADLERNNAFIIDKQREEFESYGYTISETTGRWKFEALSGHDDEVSAALLAHWGVVQVGVPDVTLLGSGDDELSTARQDYDVEGEAIEELPSLPTPRDLMVNPEAWF